MKKMFTLLAGTVLLTSLNLAFASPVTCPSPQDIRSTGSTFKHAYLVNGWDWALISQPFSFDNNQWQTTFKITLPSVMSANDAVVIGSEQFASTPLLTKPDSSSVGNKTTCVYLAMQNGAMVTASTPVDWGFKIGWGFKTR